jgi:outer membrane lipoprotein-sorting protein
LDRPQKQTVEAHLKACETCRTDLQGLQTLQQRLVDSGKALAQSDLEDQVMNRIVQEQSARLKWAAQAGMGLALRRLTMRSAVIKIGVAAAVVLAVAGGIFLWTGTKSGVALADVLSKIEQIRALTYQIDCHMKLAMPGTSPMEMDMTMTWLVADDYGMKVDTRTTDPDTGQVTEQQLYLLPDQKMMLMVTPATKKYERLQLDESTLQARKKESQDPRMLIRQMLACPYQDLGTTMLDGIEVQGFQTTDPSFTGGNGDTTLWVDVKTWLPVRMELESASAKVESRTTVRDFQWDVPVTAAEFNPVLPADYTPGLADGTKAVSPTEQGAVDGLRLCAELFGKYPEGFEPGDLMEMMKGLATSQTPAAQEFQQEMAQAKSIEERTAKTMEISMPIQSFVMFHVLLVQQRKEPAYYGKVVQPGDIAQVLLRWKTGENEYRVIFADLHTETVDADTLAKLEAALPK